MSTALTGSGISVITSPTSLLKKYPNPLDQQQYLERTAFVAQQWNKLLGADRIKFLSPVKSTYAPAGVTFKGIALDTLGVVNRIDDALNVTDGSQT